LIQTSGVKLVAADDARDNAGGWSFPGVTALCDTSLLRLPANLGTGILIAVSAGEFLATDDAGDDAEGFFTSSAPAPCALFATILRTGEMVPVYDGELIVANHAGFDALY
jgi:hypothetical protein